MTKIFLIRHAEAEGNLYRRIQGQYDSLVTPKGWKQIKALEKRFENVHIDKVFSSDLIRTQMTASAIFIPKNLPLFSRPGFKEVAMGVWEDMTWGDAEANWGDQVRRFTFDQGTWSVPGCEALADLQKRAYEAVKTAAEENDGKTIAIVSHGTIIRAFIAYLQGIPSEKISTVLHCDNTAVSLLNYEGGKFSIEYYGNVDHLPIELQTVAGQSWWKDKTGHESTNLRFLVPARAEEKLFVQKYEKSVSGETFVSLHGVKPVGVLRLNLEKSRESGCGLIENLFAIPEYSSMRFVPQFIGQAISVYRPMGIEKLKLIAPDVSGEIISSLENCGFINNEMDISYDWRKDKNIIYD